MIRRVRPAFWLRIACVSVAAVAVACSEDNGPSNVVTLSSLTLNPKTVTGGTASEGTATLSGTQTSAAVVSLTNSNTGLATAPASVTVPAGATSATFAINTNVSATSGNAVISGAFGGTTQQDTLTVNPPAIVPIVLVTGPSGNNTCRIQTGGATFDCTFDGSTSVGAIASYAWAYSFAGNTVTVAPSTNSRLQNPSTNGCSIFGGLTSATAGNVLLQVTLTVRNSGNLVVTSQPLGVTVRSNTPACGF